VDATNYVLLEHGQPLHAFDLDKLGGHTILVRRARAGEKLGTLDEVGRTLVPTDLVIADATRPIPLARAMGGGNPEGSDGTTRVLLESAYFDPRSIQKTSKRVGLHTEASHRFERGVDPNAGVALASARCAELIADWGGGKVSASTGQFYPRAIAPVRL